MSNYNSLKTTINANVKQNGVQAITGQILNEVLNEMVNTLGTGYQFAGVATTATNPGTPDAKVFYIANGKGTYTNFGSLELTEDEVVVLYWDTAWHKEATGIASQEKLTELESEVGERGYSPMLDLSDKLQNGFWSYVSGDGTIGTQVKLEFKVSASWRSTKVKVSKGSTIVVTGTPSSRFSLLITDLNDVVIVKYRSSLNNLQVEMETDGYVYVTFSASSPYKFKVTDELYNLGVINIKGIFQSLPDGIKTNDVYFLKNRGHWYRCYDEMGARDVFVPKREFIFALDRNIYKYNAGGYTLLSYDKVLKLEGISSSVLNLSVGQSYYNDRYNQIISKKSDTIDVSYFPTSDCFYLVGNEFYTYNGSTLVPLSDKKRVASYTTNRLTKPIRGYIQSSNPNNYYINTSNPIRNIFSLVGYTGNIHITIGSGYLFTIVGAMTVNTVKDGQLARNLTTYDGYVASDLLAFYVEVKREDDTAIGENEDSGMRITLDGSPMHGYSPEYESEPTDVSSIVTSDLLSEQLVEGWLTTAKIYAYYDNIVSQSEIPVDVIDFSSYVSGKPTELSDYPFKVYHVHPSYKLGQNISSAPSVVLTSGTHGAETDGVLNLATLFYSLVKNSGNSMYDKLRMCDIYILPCVNPYGIDTHSRGNYRNVNINRNMCVTGLPFDDSADIFGTLASYNNTGAFSEYESKIVKELCDRVTPDVLIDYHSFPGGFGDGCQIWYNCDFSDVEKFGDLLNVAIKTFQNFKESFNKDLPSMMPSTFARITSSDITQSISFYAHEHDGVGLTIECASVLDWTDKNYGVSQPRSTELVRCNADYAIRSLYYILSKIKPKEGYTNYVKNKVSIVDGIKNVE